jgi:two-component sensor histidine kinase
MLIEWGLPVHCKDRTLERVLAQQAALAEFGSYAFNEGELSKVLNEAVRICALSLNVPYCKICQFDSTKRTVLVVAGHGWEEGVIGRFESIGTRSPALAALDKDQPIICHDLTDNAEQWDLPSMYPDHGIVSTVNVIINGVGEAHPYGVLECDSPVRIDFDEYDIRFLTGFANVLAERVATSNTIIHLRDTLMEKSHIVQQKDVLLQELHHRVRNNLQLVYGMLVDAARRPADQALESISRRVLALAQVYDHLVGSQILHTIDCGSYLHAICINLEKILHERRVRLLCHADPLILNLEKATALGLATNEMITSSAERVFSEQGGTISVRLIAESEIATLSVQDDAIVEAAETEPDKRNGVGLVRRLAAQMRGSLDVHTNGGTVTTLIFPITKHDSAIKSP